MVAPLFNIRPDQPFRAPTKNTTAVPIGLELEQDAIFVSLTPRFFFYNKYTKKKRESAKPENSTAQRLATGTDLSGMLG